jgi:hypothetical protein
MWFKFLCFGILQYYSWYYKTENQMYFDLMNFKFPIKENSERKEKVYAIDFDNTIAYTNYPTILKPLPYAVEVLRVLTKDPYSTLILWTCREGDDLKEALNFCDICGIKFDYVNENCKRNLDLYKVDCRKVSADVYIDDHSYQGIEGVEKLWHDWYLWMKDNNML